DSARRSGGLHCLPARGNARCSRPESLALAQANDRLGSNCEELISIGGLQYGSLSLRANQRLQTCRAEHRYCRRAIRIFDRRRSKAAASLHNPNDSGATLKRRALPPFADQVRRDWPKSCWDWGRFVISCRLTNSTMRI